VDRLKLLPCPFCGGEAELRKQYSALEGEPKHYVRCSDGKCGARYVPGGFPVDEWNSRQSLSREAVRNEVLEEAAKVCDRISDLQRESRDAAPYQSIDAYSFNGGYTAANQCASAILRLLPKRGS
jgi:hypothetical protein